MSAIFAWRVAELTSSRERLALARSLGDLVDDLSSHTLPGAAPVNRVGLRPHVDELLSLAARLEVLERPVAPRGMLLVRELLTNGGSPLYLGGDIRVLAPQLAEIHRALDAV
jgi:hypothetical protein